MSLQGQKADVEVERLAQRVYVCSLPAPCLFGWKSNPRSALLRSEKTESNERRSANNTPVLLGGTLHGGLAYIATPT